jgi:hypothetical protein
VCLLVALICTQLSRWRITREHALMAVNKSDELRSAGRVKSLTTSRAARIRLAYRGCCKEIQSAEHVGVPVEHVGVLPKDLPLFERFQVSDQVRSLSGICNSGKWHRRSVHHFLGIVEKGVQRLLVPHDIGILHRAAVAESFDAAGLAAHNSTRALILGHDPTKRTSHRKRVADLCSAYGIDVPAWADPAASGKTNVARFRNETLHEGLFFGEPLGFQMFGGNGARRPEDEGILLERSSLISRIVLALLGMEKCEYVISPIGTRQMIGVRM